MVEFTPNQSAQHANRGLKFSLATRDQAQQCAVLWFEDILNRKLYRKLGYSSINQYAKLELGFSKSHTGDFMSLCRVFKKLPKVRRKVEAGELKYTAAGVLASVADEQNQDQWLDVALKTSRRGLEEAVKRAKLAAREESAGVIPLLPLVQQAHSSRRNGRPAAVVPVPVRCQKNVSTNKVDALLEIMEGFLIARQGSSQTHSKRSTRVEQLPEGKAPKREISSRPSTPPFQIHIHQCPDCGRATVPSSRSELVLSPAELERALCDGRIVAPGKRNTATIAPSVRRQALVRARHRCQRKGCDHNRFLEVHHIQPRRAGGSNDLDNLAVLCSSCHRLLHERHLQFRWPKAAVHSWPDNKE